MPALTCRTLIVGGGPAGLAPLVAASREGRLDDLLAGGLVIVERGPAIGAGRIGNYAISSDSTAETFLTAVTGHLDPRLGVLAGTRLGCALQACGRGSIPLEQAGALMTAIGAILHDAIRDSGGHVLTDHEALETRQEPDGSWVTSVHRRETGETCEIASEAVLLATGGEQPPDRLRTERVAGRALWPTYAQKLVQSDEALQERGLALVRHRLEGQASPKVAIVGGSTSALATAGLLLRRLPDLLHAPGSITLLHRRPLRVFYPSAEAAVAEGYTEFGPDDICPLSGFVFRLAGFRLDSRDLVMRIRQIGGRPPEPRIVPHRLVAADEAASRAVLDRADVIIAALGYRPRALPVFDQDGHRIVLRGRDASGAMVDARCRVVDAASRPIPNLFGIGLAAGFVPSGPLGGEPSFSGQANGLWLWQTAVGSMICDGLMADEARNERAVVPPVQNGAVVVPAFAAA